jgi:hypothetical protein
MKIFLPYVQICAYIVRFNKFVILAIFSRIFIHAKPTLSVYVQNFLHWHPPKKKGQIYRRRSIGGGGRGWQSDGRQSGRGLGRTTFNPDAGWDVPQRSANFVGCVDGYQIELREFVDRKHLKIKFR